ncbi:MAG: MGMT family protein, partial [Bradyrhizobium sp.]|uniref:methylated-DNA--[protein]-cysteine S-methyltransferase n=1 Tax=Bradyrhizobium sp. TaxID=376 RepID=UPI002730973C
MTGNSYALFDTSIGRCGIVWGARGINGVQLPMGSEDKTRTRIRQSHGELAEAPPPAEVQRAIEGMIELLAGKPNDLADIVLDLDGVPAFNRGVYDIARRIPPGQTLTYGDIA